MAIAIALTGFNDFGPLFFGWIIFSTNFLRLRKNEENLWTKSLNFSQNAPSNPVL